MSGKKLVIIAFAFVCIILAVSYFVSYSDVPGNTESPPQNNPSDIPEGPEFVIPESPVGTLGLIGVLAAALGTFAIANKRK